MDEKVAELIERMGLLVEADGLPRIAGRIVGLFLFTPGPYSLDEIAERLGVSKASVSVDSRRLTDRGFIERVTRPGDRRDYYQLAPTMFERMILHRLEQHDRFDGLVREGQTLADPRIAARLEHMDVALGCIRAGLEHGLAVWRAPAVPAPSRH